MTITAIVEDFELKKEDSLALKEARLSFIDRLVMGSWDFSRYVGIGILALPTLYNIGARLISPDMMFVGDKEAHMMTFAAFAAIAPMGLYTLYPYAKEKLSEYYHKLFPIKKPRAKHKYSLFAKASIALVTYAACVLVTYHAANSIGPGIEYLQSQGLIPRHEIKVDESKISPLTESKYYLQLEEAVLVEESAANAPSIDSGVHESYASLEPKKEDTSQAKRENSIIKDTLKDLFANNIGTYLGIFLSIAERAGTFANNVYKNRKLRKITSSKPYLA